MLTKQNIPNYLTFLRIAAVPAALVITVAFPGASMELLWLFVVAALTDYFDGILARKWNVVSPLGTLLDPVADKLLVAIVLIFLAKYTIAPVAPIALLLLRELYVSGLREFIAQRGGSLPVSREGKWKTALQLIAITVLLAALAYRLSTDIWLVGIGLLWLSTVLSIVSAVGYTRAALRASNKN